MEFLVVVLSVVITFLCVWFLFFEYYKGSLINTVNIFVALCVLDFYLPLLIRFYYPLDTVNSPWVKSVIYGDYGFSLIIFTIGLLFFVLGSILAGKVKVLTKDIKEVNYKTNKVIFSFVALSFLYLIMQYYLINFYGGVTEYLNYKFKFRWLGSNDILVPGSVKYINFFSPVILQMIFISSALIIYYRDNYKNNIFIILCVIICVFFAMTTFFRGTIVNYFLGVLFFEMIRLREKKEIRTRIKRRTMNRVIFAMLAMFIFFGMYRTVQSNIAWDEVNNNTKVTLASEINKNIKGNVLTGFTAVNEYYINGELFLGKTFYDMLMLPIPRSIYTSKPEWYGIDDITRRMGWPNTTQSAVSPQGELVANFGCFGIVFMIMFGFMFGFFDKNAKESKFFGLIYAFVLLPSITTFFWMSFTGFINAIKYIPILILYLNYLKK
ncbi:O-antigen polymerase [Photobacterium phosphoreum]|uniref:O-antigen polymerase n=1 Tax=Photobacterium phosphoreum TaxID=659 RepID=UPI0039B0156D